MVDNPHLLIVDNNDADRFALHQIVQDSGWSAESAATPEEGLALVGNKELAVVLVGISDDQCQGANFIHQLKGQFKTQHVPIIAVVPRDADPEVMEKCYENGALNTIKKPFKRKMVAHKVRSVVDLFFYRREFTRKNIQLKKEKDKSEELLLNILPHETVEELKAKGKATARHYNTVTVMFTDFRNFTAIAEKMRPEELVQELDHYFKRFDQIIEKYNIAKIKTIGDAYMCAGGIPIRNTTNPVEVVLAGLEIQHLMDQLRRERAAKGLSSWDLRVGINTGELIAGVVGTKRLAYDVWGDAVNMASRMEQNGKVGMVNVSGQTYHLIKDYFVCTYRGKVNVKNKGQEDMYFVNGIKPEFSVDGAGKVPNELFWTFMNLVQYSAVHYKKARKIISRKLEENGVSQEQLSVFEYSKNVSEVVEKLAKNEGVEGKDLFLLRTAALFRDLSGLAEVKHPDGERLLEMMRKALPKFGFTRGQVNKVERLIVCSSFPQCPQNKIEQIMCDAETDYWGRPDFEEVSHAIFAEMFGAGWVSNEQEWELKLVKAMESHQYYTSAAERMRGERKLEHLHWLKAKLRDRASKFQQLSKAQQSRSKAIQTLRSSSG